MPFSSGIHIDSRSPVSAASCRLNSDQITTEATNHSPKGQDMWSGSPSSRNTWQYTATPPAPRMPSPDETA